ncbi:hypothetical protein [Ponticaulis sp.]|uniref:hypothetical protein n=1 Tax=Ponticaulis sp. TaxID=2020902 RepID=UPI000B753E54|nr:hypothetical protein [Ponticaulis sp.]MAJ09960.1 hypothetical protein [Ponticaulis sp.]|tara:strand:- start:31040 stop:32008 length:969 start_codon:yes stop_codon:yes gene_type:complete
MAIIISVLACMACAAAGYFAASLGSEPEGVEPSTLPPTAFVAPPEAFHVSPCIQNGAVYRDELSVCLLVQAGGKRLVFGTPLHTNWRAIGPLDAVFMMDGHPLSSGGLMGLRYESWFDRRDSELLLVSGELTLDWVQQLDDALIVPDALSQVGSRNQLDSRRSGFAVRPVLTNASLMSVFNTGDLRVFASSQLADTGDQLMSYRVVYEDSVLDIYSCESSRTLMGGEAATAIFVPVFDQVQLTRHQRFADQNRLYARQMEIRMAGLNCPSMTEAKDMAQRAAASQLLTQGMTGERAERLFRDGGVSWSPLTIEGVEVDLAAQ